MASLVPTPPWIPADDLLLKNSIEAGASLEALAKGAVPFSRKYTIQELQTRWYALLYDPDTAESASADMIELERSASKLNRVGDSKGNVLPEKRKDCSVRSHYYATRKRIRAEPFSDLDVSFLDGSPLHDCMEHVKIDCEHRAGNHSIADPAADHFDLQDTEFAFRGHHQQSLKGELPNGMRGGNCLYEFRATHHHVSADKAIESDVSRHFEHYDVHNNMSIPAGANSGVQEMGPPRELPGGRLFETTKSFSKSDPVNNNPVPTCPGFGQNKSFSSHISDCNGSFHQLYSPAVPTMPVWSTMEDICTTSALNNENLDENIKGEGAAIMCPGVDGRQVGSSAYNDLHTDPQLEERTCAGRLRDSRAISDGNYVEMSNSLLNYQNEGLYMGEDDGKDMMDRSCLDRLSSILLSSPTDVHQPSTAELSSIAKDLGLIFPEELDAMDDRLESGYTTCDPTTRMPLSTSGPNPHSPERQNGVICCTINTEDPDIPCNDDDFVPNEVLPPIDSSTLQHNVEEDGSSVPPPTMDFPLNVVDSKQGLNHIKDEEFLTEPQFLPEMFSNNPLPCGMTSELQEGVPLNMPSMHIGSAEGEPGQLTPYPNSSKLKDDSATVELGRFCTFDSSMDFLLDSSAHCLEHNENDPQIIITEYKQDPNLPGAMQNHLSAEHGSFELPISEPLVNASTLDQEAQFLEEDNDVPHFSDIEALIFDMDLGQCEQDSYTEVARYQQEQARRAILRLEQGAQSYMQRAIASHKAFAVLYGRRLKQYIRKREVSLGRVTNDHSVDIDLANEGRVTGISRVQAIIKMEEDGTFCLMNKGKQLVIVNGKEVPTKHSIKLTSGSLIQIRSMSFIFEANQKVVKQYLVKFGKKKLHKRGSKGLS
ncbi:hypothetical protein ACHQM5_002897 [Ranunculus cassubicifolius]